MEEFWAAREQEKANALLEAAQEEARQEKARQEKARQEAAFENKANEDNIADQRRTWAQVMEALEYMGMPPALGTPRIPTREVGEVMLNAALAWWKKVMRRIHPDKIKVSPLATEVLEEHRDRVFEAGDTFKHAKMHGWWTSNRDRGRLAVAARAKPWAPRGGTTPPRQDFMNELLLSEKEAKHSG